MSTAQSLGISTRGDHIERKRTEPLSGILAKLSCDFSWNIMLLLQLPSIPWQSRRLRRPFRIGRRPPPLQRLIPLLFQRLHRPHSSVQLVNMPPLIQLPLNLLQKSPNLVNRPRLRFATFRQQMHDPSKISISTRHRPPSSEWHLPFHSRLERDHIYATSLLINRVFCPRADWYFGHFFVGIDKSSFLDEAAHSVGCIDVVVGVLCCSYEFSSDSCQC